MGVVALVVAGFVALSMAPAAVGAPSALSLAKKAVKSSKKAVKTGRQAIRTSRTAARTSRTAISTSQTAFNTARSAQQAAAIGDGPGTVTQVDGPAVSDAGGVVTSQAQCPAGQTLIGGGHDVGTFDSPVISRTYGTSFYAVIAVTTQDFDEDRTAEAQAFALCARSGAVAASSSRGRAADRGALRADLDRVRGEVAEAR